MFIKEYKLIFNIGAIIIIPIIINHITIVKKEKISQIKANYTKCYGSFKADIRNGFKQKMYYTKMN